MKPHEQRKHFIGRDPVTGARLFANTAAIPVRSLSCVGGLREGRNFTRRKNRRGMATGAVKTAMMLVAVANEIAKRRAKNKAATKSRQINRGR